MIGFIPGQIDKFPCSHWKKIFQQANKLSYHENGLCDLNNFIRLLLNWDYEENHFRKNGINILHHTARLYDNLEVMFLVEKRMRDWGAVMSMCSPFLDDKYMVAFAKAGRRTTYSHEQLGIAIAQAAAKFLFQE